MKRWLVILVSMFIFIQSCDDDAPDEQVFCTEEFRTIGVSITGGEFDEFYTARASLNDTIRHSQFIGIGLENFYPILDDGYHSKLANNEDTFVFYGFFQDQLLVKETYVIKADECHIELVSGKTEIEL